MQAYQKSIEQLFRELQTSRNGLTEQQVIQRQQEYGPNALPEQRRKSLLMIFLSQFKSSLIYILKFGQFHINIF